jgi:hypothetical protein
MIEVGEYGSARIQQAGSQLTVPTMTFLPVLDEFERVNAFAGSALLSCF